MEADIEKFFDNVDHEWLIKFLEHDIADKKFVDIIKKFLKVGIMEDGNYLESERGTPQGNGASPVLANIYLHRANSRSKYMVNMDMIVLDEQR